MVVERLASMAFGALLPKFIHPPDFAEMKNWPFPSARPTIGAMPATLPQ